MEALSYICPICKGRTVNVYPLIWHLERSHNITKSAGHFNVITKTMLQYWKRELKDKMFVSCLHVFKRQRDCSYFDTDILGIIEHCQSCKGVSMVYIFKLPVIVFYNARKLGQWQPSPIIKSLFVITAWFYPKFRVDITRRIKTFVVKNI